MFEMGPENLLILLFASAIAGWLAGIATRGSGLGLKGNILAAVIGALMGMYLLDIMGLKAWNSIFGTALVSLLGAFSLLAIIGRIRR